MKHIVHAIAALGLLSAIGCGNTQGGVDQKKAEKCAVKEKTNPAHEDGDACKKCCSEAGASGHMWIFTDGCTCQ